MGMGGVQVDERPTVGQRFGVGFQARRLGFEERARVLEQNAAAVQVALERSRGNNALRWPLKIKRSNVAIVPPMASRCRSRKIAISIPLACGGSPLQRLERPSP